MKYKYLLLSVILLVCLNACKKDSKAPSPIVTIAAKWFNTKQSSELYFNGVEISSSIDTTFTSVDFVEYYGDGTGYFSTSSTSGQSLTEFTYTLKGSALTQYTSTENAGTPETVTSLTANSLSIHAVSQVSDPNNPSQTDTEIDDFYYKR